MKMATLKMRRTLMKLFAMSTRLFQSPRLVWTCVHWLNQCWIRVHCLYVKFNLLAVLKGCVRRISHDDRSITSSLEYIRVNLGARWGEEALWRWQLYQFACRGVLWVVTLVVPVVYSVAAKCACESIFIFCSFVFLQSKPFWIMLRAVKEFVSHEGAGKALFYNCCCVEIYKLGVSQDKTQALMW